MKNWNNDVNAHKDDSTITEEQYREVLGSVYKRNKEVLTKFSLVAGVLFLVLFIISFVQEYEAANRITYGVMVGVEVLFYLIFSRLDNSKKIQITVINYLFFFVIYGYSAFISVSDPLTPAVAFHIFLVLMPEMLIDRPWRIIAFMVAVTTGFAAVTLAFKPTDIAYIDICNCLWVLFISIVLTAEHVKLRISGLVVRQQIESERDLDSLTGFYTKKASKREVQKKMEEYTNGAFVFLDIDNFKAINDTYGHDFGDEVLRKLADYLASYNHTTEVCGRFGGDEFLVYIPEYGSKEAVFHRVHFLLNNLKNNLDYPELNVHPKLSAGIAFYPDDGMDYDDLLRHADSAMYYSKHHGKARVTAYSEASTKMELGKN